jgi:glycosyltransferase involved in cell wall biosynthesis
LWDLCLRRADRRFYISEYVRQTWEGTTPWPHSDVVFPICKLAEGAKTPGERKGFVFAGRWIANKGVDILVEAYAEARLDPEAWPLTLVGDGPLRVSIVQRVSNMALRGLNMPGFLPDEAKAEAIRSAKFMVVPPNTCEDFGLTAIEARHLGVPCIITRDGGLPEAAGDEALSCEPGDVAGLAACLRQAAAMPEAEYARRSESTRIALAGELRSPAFYDAAYRELRRTRP